MATPILPMLVLPGIVTKCNNGSLEEWDDLWDMDVLIHLTTGEYND